MPKPRGFTIANGVVLHEYYPICDRKTAGTFALRNGLLYCLTDPYLPILEDHLFFWREHPALLAGLSATIGTSSYLFWSAAWGSTWMLLWSMYLLCLKKRNWIAVLLLSWLYAFGLFHSWCDASFPQTGKGLFSPSGVHLRSNTFGQGWFYQGTFQIDSYTLPASFYWSSNHPDRPPGNQDFWITGQLEPAQSPYRFFLAVDPKTKWETAVKAHSHWAEIRCQLKERLNRYLVSRLEHIETATFLMALLSGEMEESWLRTTFSKIGVQHILAVSGFHFAILAAFMLWILRHLFSHQSTLWILLCLLTGYFLWIGSSPSVLRAWLTFALWMMGSLWKRCPSALNLLGICLCVEIFCDPLSLAHLGLQFSFCSVGAILLLHPILQSYLPLISPDRTRQELRALPLRSSCGALLCKALLQTVSLTLAIHLVILPLTLCQIRIFPWLGLFYNLLIPSLAGLSLIGTTIALCLTPLPELLSQCVWTCTELLTQELLHLALYPPITCDYVLLARAFPAWIFPPYLFFLFVCSRILKYKKMD